MKRRCLISLLLIGVVLTGCRGFGGAHGSGCPVSPADVASLPASLRAQGAMRVDQTTLGFALERRGDDLTMIGFTPFGTRAFAIVQHRREVEIDDFVGERIGVRPVWLLDALHRAFLIRPPETDGEPATTWDWRGERVDEDFDARGRATTRRFTSGAGAPTLLATIHYNGSDGAEVESHVCGYHARIVMRDEPAAGGPPHDTLPEAGSGTDEGRSQQ